MLRITIPIREIHTKDTLHNILAIVVDSVGVTIKGMPYHYGGKDTIGQWTNDYENGGKGPGAHSAHYSSNPPNSLSWALGIDFITLI
jgi:hypothetical protein